VADGLDILEQILGTLTEIGQVITGQSAGIPAAPTPSPTPMNPTAAMALSLTNLAVQAMSVGVLMIDNLVIGNQDNKGAKGQDIYEEKKKKEPKEKQGPPLLQQASQGIGKGAGMFDGILSLIGGSQSAAVQTFLGSIQLLGGAIGSLLTPALINASEALQEAWNWFNGLNQTTKDTIGYWLSWTGVVVGTAVAVKLFITVLSPIGSLLAGVVGAFRLATVAASAFGAVIMAHPIVATVAAVVALGVAVAALSGAFKTVGDKIENTLAKINDLEAALERLRGGGKATFEDFNREEFTAEERRQVLATEGKPKERQQLLESIAGGGGLAAPGVTTQSTLIPQDPAKAKAKEMEARLAADAVKEGLENTKKGAWFPGAGGTPENYVARKQAVAEAFERRGMTAEQAKEAANRHLPAGGKGTQLDQGNLSDKEIGDIAQEPLRAIRRQQLRQEVARRGLEQGGNVPITLEDRRKAEKEGGKTGPDGKPLLRSIPKEVQPQFSSFEQARKNIQIASLEGDPIQRAQMEQMRENNRHAAKTEGNVAGILASIRAFLARQGFGENK